MEETDPALPQLGESTVDLLSEGKEVSDGQWELSVDAASATKPKATPSSKPNSRTLHKLLSTRHFSFDRSGSAATPHPRDNIHSTTSLTRTLSRQKAGKMRSALRRFSVVMFEKEHFYRNVTRLEQLLDSVEFATLSRSTSDESNIVRINVSGLVFETTVETLESKPNSLLGDINKRNRYYLPERDELFFDRCRRSFVEILSYYQTNEIKRPEGVGLATFVQEMHFFQLDYDVIQKLLVQEKAIRLSNSKKKLPTGKKKRRIWELLSVPESSPPALVVYFVRLMLHLYLLLTYLFSEEIMKAFGPKFLEISEIVANAILLVDFTARLATCPDLKHFMLSFFTIVDIISFAMVIVLVTLTQLTVNLDNKYKAALGAVMKTLQMFRLLQLFRYSKSNVTNALTIALRNSVMEIMSIFLVVIILSFFFGSMLFLIESSMYGDAANSTNTIKSLGDGIWLAIVTMTTVGYGDFYPVTWAGRAVATVCVCFGQVVISMIIPIVSNLYQEFYNGRIMENKLVGMLYKQIQQNKVRSEETSKESSENVEEISGGSAENVA